MGFYGLIEGNIVPVEIFPLTNVALFFRNLRQHGGIEILSIGKGYGRDNPFICLKGQYNILKNNRKISTLQKFLIGDGLCFSCIADPVNSGRAALNKIVISNFAGGVNVSGNGSQIIFSFTDLDHTVAVGNIGAVAGNAADLVLSGQRTLRTAATDDRAAGTGNAAQLTAITCDRAAVDTVNDASKGHIAYDAADTVLFPLYLAKVLTVPDDNSFLVSEIQGRTVKV